MGSDEYHERLKWEAGCVDLWRVFGNDYKINTDPAYDSFGIRRDNLDPWYYTIPCRYGVIWPYGREMLALDMDYHDIVARRVATLSFVKLIQDGDREKTFIFPVERFREMAALVRPLRRKRMPTGSADRLAGWRFRKPAPVGAPAKGAISE